MLKPYSGTLIKGVNKMINGFKPIIDSGCQILILGTMPSAESIKKQEYYEYKRNHFWKIIFSLYDRELMDNYEDKKAFLLKNHIAIWDVLESCERDDSSDTSIRNPKVNDFNWLFNQYPNINSIYFNGKTAEKLYQKLIGKNTGNRFKNITTLPSTSPANAVEFVKKLKEWRIILS